VSEVEKIIAHVRKNADGSWAAPQKLVDHLDNTAVLAERFAAAFGSGDWGKACGLAHDAGKAREEWQRYLVSKSGFYDEEAHLETKTGKVDHSTPSAKFVEEIYGKGVGRILSYCIAGHHAGLPDWIGSQSALSFRLNNSSSSDIIGSLRSEIAVAQPSNSPWKFDPKGLDLSLWIRMLFSCLVDADFLDTESYMDSEKARERGGYLSAGDLLERFNMYMTAKTSEALRRTDSQVNRVRQQVLADCRSAALGEPGFFSLTVPTGGGKTLSSMAFALEHAVRYNKSRIIYVIPYTSIIEQNADVFREALGTDQIVEHHSNLDEADATIKSRLAAENWDAPVIVTTSVQFFESLFAARTSRCRKLHNIADSIVVLDEAQLMPVEYLKPILEAMRLLVQRYRTSFVICTATQPALEEKEGFPGLPLGSVREIVCDVPRLYEQLKRVEMAPVDTSVTKSWEEIADELSAFDRALCIVSDRKSCRELYGLMPKGTYHLSALMCAQHRSDYIAEIKKKLQGEGKLRLISTQLVEAGVDIDFPVVYRAMAGLDSIAQAAGRCNREGKLAADGKLGRLVVFVPPRKAPIGILRKAAETATRLLDEGLADPLSNGAFSSYFEELYWKADSLDAKEIIKLLTPDNSDCGIQFRSAAEAFMMIDDSLQRTILIPYKDGGRLISLLEKVGPERWLLRILQRYTVNVYLNQFKDLLARGSIKEVSPGIFALICSVEYDEGIGLLVDELSTDPTAYMAFT
jgi:CRISPR-associated endonuclease/helicase Cas3